jgi:hypothetical protein
MIHKFLVILDTSDKPEFTVQPKGVEACIRSYLVDLFSAHKGLTVTVTREVTPPQKWAFIRKIKWDSDTFYSEKHHYGLFVEDSEIPIFVASGDRVTDSVRECESWARAGDYKIKLTDEHPHLPDCCCNICTFNRPKSIISCCQ